MKFNVATEEEILSGDNADVYFSRALKILEKHNFHRRVTMEVTVSSFEHPWLNFTGLDEVIALLDGKVESLYAIPEGSIVPYRDSRGIPLPFMILEGDYEKIGLFETSILGLVCQSSGISSAASRVRIVCAEKPFFSFGIRRMHPAISPMIDRAAYIGGADGVSGIKGAKLVGKSPVGTMPHALSLLLGDDDAWKSVAESTATGENVTVLIDTYDDEKFAALKAAKSIPSLNYVRLDTPSSRRGNFAAIIREVRWELDLRGFKDVKIMVSGGLTENEIPLLREAGADAFGVGTSIASGKPVDFAMDIVALDGVPLTKKGKFSGKKMPFRCKACHAIKVVPEGKEIGKCACGGDLTPLMEHYISNGKTIRTENSEQARKRAMSELQFMVKSSE